VILLLYSDATSRKFRRFRYKFHLSPVPSLLELNLELKEVKHNFRHFSTWMNALEQFILEMEMKQVEDKV